MHALTDGRPAVRSPPRAPSAVQRSFADLGTPLSEVTFVVIDLETTGGSPNDCEITEVGAVKIRGGEVLGTFQTLVNPGTPIPPSITFLTGITEVMVLPAPRIDEILQSVMSFVGGAVIVGHNVRFDLGFLRAAMHRSGWSPFTNPSVDTCALARRLVRDEVPNCRLDTLSSLFGVSHRPTHRALDDAWATVEVFHALLERAASLGVLGLEDLLALPRIGAHPQFGKLTLTSRLPRRPGVYVFRDAGRRPLYVGKAVDLRRRVRSYFSGDDRRKVGGLLRELASIDHVECTSELEASVLEVRMIHDLAPRYNRQAKHWRGYRYVKLTLDEPWPRLSVVHQARAGDGCVYLGPVGSVGTARRIVEAIETVVPLRRCTTRPPAPGRAGAREAPCTAAQLGVATCPCAGTVSHTAYRALADTVAGALGTALDGALDSALDADPSQTLFDPLLRKMGTLAAQQRYEEAADLRDRAGALARAIERQRRHHALRRAGRLELQVPTGAWAVVDHGLLASAGRGDGPPEGLPFSIAGRGDGPVPRHLADEVATIVAWLDGRAAQVRVLRCEGELALPTRRGPSFEPREGS